MAAADQIKSLIQSFGEGDDARFYAIAMQIAASEARKGNLTLAEELKKLINRAKEEKGKLTGIVKKLPVNSAQKELSELFELITPDEKLGDMVLAQFVQNSLQRVLDEQRELELLRQHNLSPRRKLLLVGPPGCGKTMSAKVLAHELGVPLFIIRLDGLISRYMGESISKLRLIFDAMHQFKAIYLFDEFDSIGTTRHQGNEIGEIKRVLNSFLLQIEKDDSNSLIIAATNIPGNLDVALFRRFDDIINYPLPDVSQIGELFKKELEIPNKGKTITIKKLAESAIGLSFADIHRICEDYKKDLLVYGKKYASADRVLDYIKLRKNPF